MLCPLEARFAARRAGAGSVPQATVGAADDACTRPREFCIYVVCRARIVPPISRAAGRAGGRFWSLSTARFPP